MAKTIKEQIADREEARLEKQVNEMNKKHVIASGLSKTKRKKMTPEEKKAKQAVYAHNHRLRQKAKKEAEKTASVAEDVFAAQKNIVQTNSNEKIGLLGAATILINNTDINNIDKTLFDVENLVHKARTGEWL